MRAVVLLLILIFSSFAPAAETASPIWKTLTARQRFLLQTGHRVLIEKRLPGSPWPEVFYLRRVGGTDPEGAAAVFWDVEDHVAYLKDLGLQSQTLLEHQGGFLRCRAVVPYLDGKKWVNWEYVAQLDGAKSCSASGCSYFISWGSIGNFLPMLLPAHSTLAFDPFPIGPGTLMTYSMRLTPIPAIAADEGVSRQLRKQIVEHLGTIVDGHAERMERGPSYRERMAWRAAVR